MRARPLPPNGCAATVSAAGVAFCASRSSCGELKWTRSSHVDCWNPPSGRIVALQRRPSIDISMQTQLQDADGDAHRRRRDVSRPCQRDRATAVMTAKAFHPLADLLPLIGGVEFDRLVD